MFLLERKRKMSGRLMISSPLDSSQTNDLPFSVIVVAILTVGCGLHLVSWSMCFDLGGK